MINPRRQILMSLSLLALAGCVHNVGEALQSGQGFSLFGDDGRWVGPVAPTKPDCGQQTTGLMTLSSGKFSFDPFQSVVIVEGTVDAGRLAGEVTRSAPGEKAITMRLMAMIDHPKNGPAAIEGTLTSGRCSWNVALRRG